MAAEEPDWIAIRIVGPCRCDPAYKDRSLQDPECAWCEYGQDISEVIQAERDALQAELARVRAALETLLAYPPCCGDCDEKREHARHVFGEDVGLTMTLCGVHLSEYKRIAALAVPPNRPI